MMSELYIMQASDARKESAKIGVINECKRLIVDAIKRAIEYGKFSCSVDLDADLPDTVCNRLKQELVDKGYTLEFKKCDPIPPGCPTSQWVSYNTIKIVW